MPQEQKKMRRLVWGLLLAPILLLLAFPQPFLSGTDPDYWWHVRTGRLIWETGAIPRQDPYSFTAAGQPWLAHEWLSEVLLYAVEGALGYVGNAALFGLVSAAIALLIYLTCREWGVGEVLSAIGAVWGLYLAGFSLNVRPQALTSLLLAATALVLTRYRRGKGGPLWLLPPLFALWVNLHGGYVIGLALLGLTIIGEGASGLRGRPAAPLRPLLLATLASAAATLLNPHGLEALTYPLSYAGAGNASMKYIQEWQAPDFHQAAFLPLAAAYLAAMAVGLWRAPVGLTGALWALALGGMALISARHVQLFAIALMPVLVARLGEEAPALARPLARWRRPRLLAVLWPLLMLLTLEAVQQGLGEEGVLQLGAQPSAKGYPAGAVAYLREEGLEGRLFNEYGWGGYLIHELYPEHKVFIDGRADVYGDEFMERYMGLTRLEEDWDQAVADYDLRLALVRADSPLAAYLRLHPGWEEAYRDEEAALYVRSGTRDAH